MGGEEGLGGTFYGGYLGEEYSGSSEDDEDADGGLVHRGGGRQ